MLKMLNRNEEGTKSQAICRTNRVDEMIANMLIDFPQNTHTPLRGIEKEVAIPPLPLPAIRNKT